MPDELNAEWAEKVLQSKHDRPFFMAVGFNRPHTPLHVPQKFFDKFDLDSIIMPETKEHDLLDCANALWNPNGTWNNAGFKKYDFLTNHPKPGMWKKWVRAYLANVAFVDEQVGKVLNALKKSEYANNTIVVFTSDHGYHLGEKEFLFKCSLWEESSRIPLIFSLPGMVHGGSRISHPVALIDMYPTLIDLCGLSTNPNRHTNQLKLDGYSLAPFLSNPNTQNWDGPDFAIISIASNDKLKDNEAGDPQKQYYAMRTERYRYILCPNGEEELYDHNNDPFEWNNLAGSPDYKHVKDEFKSQFITKVLANNQNR
jgi:arylsulfatase A-like enzyme